MTILLTGGTGKSTTPLARLLHAAGHPILLASRSGTAPHPFPAGTGVKFDWLDASTFDNAFAATAPSNPVDRVYLVPPSGIVDMLPAMRPFIDFAVVKGVKRFVLMSAGLIEAGGPAMGKVHEYLAQHQPEVEFCVLRPSYFFENFLQFYSDTIRERDEVVSATEDGRIGFVSTEDIAEVAFHALVDPEIKHKEPIIVGPELLSYDQIASRLSQVLNRPIKHKRISVDELITVFLKRGMGEEYARIMAQTDAFIADGAEEQLYARADVVGTRKIGDFFEENKGSEALRTTV
ncbi:NAD(P)-binding protein [Mycena kentingensis (nom. inval.)]|nr:NAD(P)-binding protein [Mycena kentingensis (nom. inval.)]